jgi:hypothetical protein
MNRPMMRPTQQGQVGQVSRATIQPMDQMMGFAPGQRPITTRKDTAPVTHSQGGALGRLDDPAGPPHVQGLAGSPTQDRRQQGRRRAESGRQSAVVVGVVLAWVAAWVVPVAAGVVVVVTGGLAGDQEPGHGPVAGQPPTPLRIQDP